MYAATSSAGLHPVTLRFYNGNEEAGFMSYRRQRMTRALRRAAGTVLAAVTSIHVLMQIQLQSGSYNQQFAGQNMVAHYSIACVSIAVLISTLPKVALSDTALERVGATMVVMCMILAMVGDPYATRELARHLGISVPEVSGYGVIRPIDAYNTVLTSSLLLGGHIMLPLRFWTTLSIEIAAMAQYTVYVWLAGTPAGSSTVILFYFLAFCCAMGKHQLESVERVLFASYLAEKVLRVQAEFELSHASPPAEACTDEEVSATSANIFGQTYEESNLTGMIESNLTGMIASIGEKEQWLITAEELVLYPELVLGQGGFGTVVLGKLNETPIAVKLTKATGRLGSLPDLANELRIIRKLRHPNIVLFHGACLNLESGDMLLATELVQGQTMEAYIDSKTLEDPSSVSRCQALLGVCRALMYLHSRRPNHIVHGDLKPGNIMIEQRFGSAQFVHAKLLDFGISRLLTQPAKPLGMTFRWAAPEVFLGRKVATEADMFSLGNIIFFMVTGTKPTRLSDAAIARIAMRGDLPPLDWPLFASPLSQHCHLVVEQCRIFNPASRASAKAVYETLRTWPGLFELADLQASAVGITCDFPQEKSDSSIWEQVRSLQGSGKASSEKKSPKARRSLADWNSKLSRLPEEQSQVRLRQPDFLQTPRKSEAMSLMHCLEKWNFPLQDCCSYHNAVDELEACLYLLGKVPCYDLDDGSPYRQCPDCKTLEEVDDSGEVFQCVTCGYAGTTVPSSQSRKSL